MGVGSLENASSLARPVKNILERQVENIEHSLPAMQRTVEKFVSDRNWQGFHNPKNLAMALAVEAGELMEHFQWLTLEEAKQVAQDDARKAAVGEEVCDVLAYTLALASALNLDLPMAFRDKMAKNARKYPLG